MAKLLHKEITDKIIGAAFEVYREIGYGFLEKVYKKAMIHEWTPMGVKCEEEPPTPAMHKGVKLLDYFGDLLINFGRDGVKFKRLVF